MKYIIPSDLRDELLFGELSDKIDDAINKCAPYIFSHPEFEEYDIDSIKNVFVGYICYQYLILKDDVERYVFLKTLNSSEPCMRLYPLLDEFIQTCLSSVKTDKQLEEDANEVKREYNRILNYRLTTKYIELSKNDSEYRKLIDKNIKELLSDIKPRDLLVLTKCVIIDKADDYEFSDTDKAILYAMELYHKFQTPLQERIVDVAINKGVLFTVMEILEENELTR